MSFVKNTDCCAGIRIVNGKDSREDASPFPWSPLILEWWKKI